MITRKKCDRRKPNVRLGSRDFLPSIPAVGRWRPAGTAGLISLLWSQKSYIAAVHNSDFVLLVVGTAREKMGLPTIPMIG